MPFGTLQNAVEGRVKLMGLPAEPLSALLTFGAEGTEQGFGHSVISRKNMQKISCPVLLQWGKLDLRVTQRKQLLSTIILLLQ